MKVLLGTVVSIFLLAGCGPSQSYRDTTGADRGFDEMHADEISCIKEVDDWQSSTGSNCSLRAS